MAYYNKLKLYYDGSWKIEPIEGDRQEGKPFKVTGRDLGDKWYYGMIYMRKGAAYDKEMLESVRKSVIEECEREMEYYAKILQALDENWEDE